MKTRLLAALGLVHLAAPIHAQKPEPPLLDAMDALSFTSPDAKARVEMAEGRVGQAQKFSFDEGARSLFVRGRVAGSLGWDRAAGLSFWVKGDGSPHLGALEVVWAGDYARRYAFAFPISGTGWRKVTVAWRDLIPQTAIAQPLIGEPGGEPSKLGPLTFGKWWFWRDYPAHSYAIDDIRLEPTIARPEPARPVGDPLARVKAKLRAGEPVTFVTMGDSLTDVRHWANRDANWPAMLQQRVKERAKSELRVENVAIGGTELRQNLVLLPRWVQSAPAPDVVTIFFGSNDWSSGARGAQWEATVRDAVRRVREATAGRCEVLILTSAPALEEPEGYAEMAAASRRAARAENAGLADVGAAFSGVAAGERAGLYVDDKVHLSRRGHELVARAVAGALGL